MKFIGTTALCAAALALTPVQAQQIDYRFGGSVLNHDLLWASDFAQLSRTHAFGTARVMGMGGAFASLGADLSAMALNPAGLGMYRRNEITLTPLVPVTRASNSGVPGWQSNSSTRFGLANLGVALNVFESSSAKLAGLTIGIGLNRIADFNARYSFSSESVYDPQTGAYMPTIGDIFSQQLNTFKVHPSADNSVPFDAWNPNVWPAILGYDGYMVDYFAGEPQNPWGVARIGGNASVLHSLDIVHRGSINEFDFSVGGNFDNVFYFGATLGIQSVYRKTTVTYQEEYGYFNTDGLAQSWNGAAGQWEDLAQQLDRMNLYQRTTLSGCGVNFKLGVIVRPRSVPGLRIGTAFHTPTWYSLDRSYRAELYADIRDNATRNVVRRGNETPPLEDESPDNWNFTSPARWMVGASYTFGQIAVLSVDYQRDWYNGIRAKQVPRDSYLSLADYKAELRHDFRATNSLRAGVEVKPLPVLAVRLGGGFSDSMLNDSEAFCDRADTGLPMTARSHYFSAGLGFRLSRSATLDVAYQNVAERLTRYRLFFSQNGLTDAFETWSGTYETSLHRHCIALSLSFRF